MISIHALLAESDCLFCVKLLLQLIFLSTLSLRRATTRRASRQQPAGISIHALLAESDDDLEPSRTRKLTFLSTLSLRRATIINRLNNISTVNFYPRSPCGERHNQSTQQYKHRQFLSTLSLRRATTWQRGSRVTYVISIHALLAESDRDTGLKQDRPKEFLSTLSLRRATSALHDILKLLTFLSTLSLRRATHYDNYNLHCVEISIHALLAESDYHKSKF